MGKIGLLIVILVLFSCNKDKEEEPKLEPEPCQNLNMAGDLDRITGKWKWINTHMSLASSFDCEYYSGSTVYASDVNFTFKLEITDKGQLKVIKNDTLIDVVYITGIYYSMVDQFNILHSIFYYNCSDKIMSVYNYTSHDTLKIELPHVNFSNANQTQQTYMHLFVRN